MYTEFRLTNGVHSVYTLFMNNTVLRKEKVPEFVGVKEFRNNISNYIAKAQKSGKKIILTVNNIPTFEMRPIKKEQVYSKQFIADILEAEEDVKHGRVYSHEYVLKKFGFKK